MATDIKTLLSAVLPIGYTGSIGYTGYTGSKGDSGLGFTIAKTYTSVAALLADTAPIGITAGQFALIENGNVADPENSRLYLWTGTAYSYVTDLSGAQGIKGETGSKGDIGFTGSAGAGVVAGTTGQVIYSNDGVAVGASSLYYDNVNSQVGIGTTSPAYKLQVVGSFAATTKSFVIDHPTIPDMKLRYGSLEGPENGIYVRGRLTNSNMIALPDYWTGLIDYSSITVNLTPIGEYQMPYVSKIENNNVYIENSVDCYFIVYAERIDVDKLIVEFKSP